ncbi:MAG: hypothetical protein HDT30_08475 [Clostridiales bacterium]|nr:hypothetical protein [Clostridiales bacterium]
MRKIVKKVTVFAMGALMLGGIVGIVNASAASSGPVWYHYVQNSTVYSQYYHPECVHSSATGYRSLWDGSDHVKHRSGLVVAKKISYSSYANYNGIARAWYNSYK